MVLPLGDCVFISELPLRRVVGGWWGDLDCDGDSDRWCIHLLILRRAILSQRWSFRKCVDRVFWSNNFVQHRRDDGVLDSALPCLARRQAVVTNSVRMR